MNPFSFERASGIDAAVQALAARPGATFIAGGTNLVDLMKEDVTRPTHLVDIRRLPLRAIEQTSDGGLRLGALATNADTARHELVTRHQPLVAQALLAGASPQLRNMATDGGNLLQRTRCYYFYDVATPCNKREPGSGCPAIGGQNRIHAILGASEHCIAVHPSDFCVALAALDAEVHVAGPKGPRTIRFDDFHRLPGDAPHLDTTLAPGELVTAIVVPANELAGHTCYLKVRDRQSYAFALVSVAAAIALGADGRVSDVRLALGGVAHKPWRDRSAEMLLLGKKPDDVLLERVAAHVLRDARGYGHNDFKIELARRAMVRALGRALRGEQEVAA